MKQGLFITFEGADGTGKTTQIAKIASGMREQGYEVVCTREPGGTKAAERIRETIHKRAWPYRNITASFGVATSVNGELTREELIRRADMALYASKEGGRDRVSLYQDSHDVAA